MEQPNKILNASRDVNRLGTVMAWAGSDGDKQPNEILIDEKSQKNIQDIVRTINELQGRLQIIMQTIVNCAKAEGNYKLSDDLSKLVRIEDPTIS